MDEVSHLKLMTMSLLQTCGYISEQMQAEVTIDVNKFLGAFSIEVAGSRVHPPLWTQNEDNTTNVISPIPIPLTGEAAATPGPFSMEDYRKTRQAEALRWIDLQEKRSSIIARLQPVTREEYEQLRNAVKAENRPLCRKGKKQGMIKYSY